MSENKLTKKKKAELFDVLSDYAAEAREKNTKLEQENTELRESVETLSEKLAEKINLLDKIEHKISEITAMIDTEEPEESETSDEQEDNGIVATKVFVFDAETGTMSPWGNLNHDKKCYEYSFEVQGEPDVTSKWKRLVFGDVDCDSEDTDCVDDEFWDKLAAYFAPVMKEELGFPTPSVESEDTEEPDDEDDSDPSTIGDLFEVMSEVVGEISQSISESAVAAFAYALAQAMANVDSQDEDKGEGGD